MFTGGLCVNKKCSIHSTFEANVGFFLLQIVAIVLDQMGPDSRQVYIQHSSRNHLNEAQIFTFVNIGIHCIKFTDRPEPKYRSALFIMSPPPSLISHKGIKISELVPALPVQWSYYLAWSNLFIFVPVSLCRSLA